MTALVRTELLKLLWTRGTWGLLAAALLVVIVRVELVLLGVGRVGSEARGSTELALAVLGSSGIGVLVIVLLGVVTVTREFHHATWTSTLVATPARTRVLVAKAAAAAVVGISVAAVLFVVAGILGVVSGDVTVRLDAATARLLLGGLLAAACWAWFGVAVGALIGNQTVAVVVPLAWLLVVEPLLGSFGLRGLLPWTPGGATSALSGAGSAGALPFWAAVLVLVGYGSSMTAAGVRRLVRADVT